MHLVQFREAGTKRVPSTATSTVIKNLTPATGYTFGVSVVTDSYGKVFY